MDATMLKAALLLAAKGYRVFPCAAGTKIPLSGGHGHLDATVDEKQIREWWTLEENANVALACGASGVVAIDVDPRHGGEATMARLFDELGALPETVESATGGPDGGRHLLFRAPHGLLVGALGPGVDVKHEGYILVEPSIHPSGGVYRWTRSLLDTDPAELPESWANRLRKAETVERASAEPPVARAETDRPYGRAAVEYELGKVRGAAQGERNSTVNKAAFSLAQLHAGSEIGDVRGEVVRAAVDVGLPEPEARATVASGWRAGTAKPRSAKHEEQGVGSSGSGTAESWPAPEPLPDGLPPVPAFDDRLLPDMLRPWLADTAERLQCPGEYLAAAAIVSVGAVVGRRCTIRPKSCDDWTVVPNPWGAVIGPPAAMKSPAIAEAQRPLRRLMAEAAIEHEARARNYEAECALAEARRSGVKAKMRKAAEKGDATATLIDEYSAAADPLRPTERRYMVNDVTMEKLGELLIENPNGLLLNRDELAGQLATLDRDGHENDRAFLLEGWDGTHGYTQDRIGRGTRHIPAVCISLFGGIQPGVLAQYLSAAVRGGAGDDGLMQRFQVMVYPDPPRQWRNVDRGPDSSARERVFQVFQRLSQMEPSVVDATVEEGALPYLRFAPDAQELFDDWLFELMGRLRAGEEHPAVEGHLMKYRKLMPALSIIFHLVDGGSGAVALPSAQRAAAWCDFLEAHARRVYSCVTAEKMRAAKALLAKLKAGKLRSPFTARDVYRPAWTGLVDRDVVSNALNVLVDYGWLMDKVVETSGRPRSEYVVHPSAMGEGGPLLSVLSVPETKNIQTEAVIRAAQIKGM